MEYTIDYERMTMNAKKHFLVYRDYGSGQVRGGGFAYDDDDYYELKHTARDLNRSWFGLRYYYVVSK